MADIQELLTKMSKDGIPEFIKDEYESALKTAAKKMWRGMMTVAASGFGKGVLFAIGAVLLVTAMVSGWQNAGVVTSTFEHGFKDGIGEGIRFLFSKFGLATMAFGGAVGAVSDVRKAQHKISADLARVEAKEYALARERQLA